MSPAVDANEAPSSHHGNLNHLTLQSFWGVTAAPTLEALLDFVNVSTTYIPQCILQCLLI